MTKLLGTTGSLPGQKWRHTPPGVLPTVKLGNYQKAIADANQAIIVAPTTCTGYYSRGYTRIRWAEVEAEHGNHAKSRTLYQNAINDYTESIQLDSKGTLILAKMYNELGWTKYLMGKLEIEQGQHRSSTHPLPRSSIRV